MQFIFVFSHGTRCMGRVGAELGGGCDGGVAPNVRLVGMHDSYDEGKGLD